MQIYASAPIGNSDKPQLKKFTSWKHLIGYIELEGSVYYLFDGEDTPRKVPCTRASTELVRLHMDRSFRLVVGDSRLDLFSYEE